MTALSLGRRLAIWWHVRVEYRLENYGDAFNPTGVQTFVCAIGRALYVTRRWFAGARSLPPTTSEDTCGSLCEGGLEIEFSGACPVQGEGTVDGRACYYRSRGEGWQFHIAAPRSEDVFAAEAWVYERDPYFFPDGGWVGAEVSIACIREAMAAYRREMGQ